MSAPPVYPTENPPYPDASAQNTFPIPFPIPQPALSNKYSYPDDSARAHTPPDWAHRPADCSSQTQYQCSKSPSSAHPLAVLPRSHKPDCAPDWPRRIRPSTLAPARRGSARTRCCSCGAPSAAGYSGSCSTSSAACSARPRHRMALAVGTRSEAGSLSCGH